MIEFTFIDWNEKPHSVCASELGAAFQYADECLRQGISFIYFWIEIQPLTYKLGLRN